MLGAKTAWPAIQTVLLALLRIPNRSGNGIKQSEPSVVSFELYERGERRGGGGSRETEDGRTPWRLSGLSSKKGKLWLILAKNVELHLLQFSGYIFI